MKNIITILILLFITALGGCKKQLDRIPVGTIDIDAFYKTASDAETALLGCYNRVFGPDFNTKLMLFNDVCSDDEKPYQGGGSEAALDTRKEITKFNNWGDQIWPTAYNAIANINLLLEKIEELPDNVFLKQGRKQEIKGEASFLRAYVYWHLVHHFGGVPIVLKFPKSTAANDNKIPRSTVDEVYSQILKDLKDAEALLPSNYDVAGVLPAENLRNTKGRITKWAAKMMLCRWYLDKKDWTNAAAKSKEIIDANLFKLSDDPARDNNFQRIFFGTQNTEESILEVQNIQNEMDQGGFIFLHLGTFPPIFGTTEDLYYSAFDTSNGNGVKDIRRQFTVGQAGPTGPYYAVKYRKFFGDADPDNYVIFRYAETILIQAEALNELQGPNTISLGYVNTLRQRAKGVLTNVTYTGAPAITTIPATKELMRELIQNERRRELALEGLRWYDLLRYGNDVAMAAIRKSTGNNFADPNKLILPVPLREEQIGGLTQNQGY